MNHQPGPNEMVRFIQEYIHECKNEIWNPQQVNLFELQEAFNFAIMWYSKQFAIHVLRDRQNKIVKIF